MFLTLTGLKPYATSVLSFSAGRRDISFRSNFEAFVW